MNFLCIYLGEGRGGTNACIYMGIHIVSLYYRTAWWVFMKFGRDEVLMARICVNLGFLSDPLWGGSKAGQEVKESFKDKRLYLECCHSGSGFGQIFQGVDPGRAKIGRGGASPLTKSSFRPNVHSNILMYCWRHVHLFDSCHSGCLFFWLNCLLLVIRWAIKGPWASSYYHLVDNVCLSTRHRTTSWKNAK